MLKKGLLILISGWSFKGCGGANITLEIKKSTSQRNPLCGARLDIKMKNLSRDTKKNDSFLRRTVPLQAIIRLTENHNHSTQSADALRMLCASPDTKEAFRRYFDAGMGPAEAIRHHEAMLAAQPDGPLLLANSSVNPIKRSVYWWHGEWRDYKYGPAGNPVAKLQEKAALYAAAGKRAHDKFSNQLTYLTIDLTNIGIRMPMLLNKRH